MARIHIDRDGTFYALRAQYFLPMFRAWLRERCHTSS
jgi:hypothetical protein